MTLARTARLAIRALARHRVRTFLMMLGVTIGVASLTALASVGESAAQETMRRFKRMLGTFDTVIVRPGAGRTRGMPSLTTVEPTLTFDDARAIASELPLISRVAEVQNAFDIDVKYRDRSATPAVFGVSANWAALRDDEIVEGRSLDEDDVRTLARVAVIGSDVRRSLFGDDNPLGQALRIADVPFQVIGVLAPRGAAPSGGSLDNFVSIPVSTASKRLFNRDFLTMVIAQVKESDKPQQNERAIAGVTALLRERHRLASAVQDDFTITNPRAVAARVVAVGSTLSRVLTGVAILATLIGGVVIMGLMLIAVSERRKEIGIRRSVGASRADVLLQFLAEAVAISLLGGIVGLVLGAGGMSVAAWLQRLPPVLAWRAAGVELLVSMLVGLVFGVHPAWKASKVDPIAALRS
jgi:putative ABC transport system permease protein